MTPEERAYAVCQEMESRMLAHGVVTTAHYDAGCQLIATAIREAVLEEREACAKVVENHVPEPHDDLPPIAPLVLSDERRENFRRELEQCATPGTFIEVHEGVTFTRAIDLPTIAHAIRERGGP